MMKVKLFFAIIAILCLSDQSFGQVYYPTYNPSTYVEYIFGMGQRDGNRVYRTVRYVDGRWLTVPVIDNFVPEIRNFDYPDGSKKIVYDYRSYTYLDTVPYKGKVYFQEDKRKTLLEAPRAVENKSPVIEKYDNRDFLNELPSSPYQLDFLPEGLRHPDQIDEPIKMIIPRYKESNHAPS